MSGLLIAAATAPAAVTDNFNDGNDTTPAPAWQRYNPLGMSEYGFPEGNTYRLSSPPSPDPANYGPGRVGSMRPENYTSFYVAADMVGWDDSQSQIAGVLARISSIGPGTTKGYLFSHDRGNPPTATSGDMDIARLDGEVGTSLGNLSGSDSIYFDPTKQYRLVFLGIGPDFLGQVYELPNTLVPVVQLTARDTAYTSGVSGLVAANNAVPTYDGSADATFDNFVADVGGSYWWDNFADGNDTSPLPAWVHYDPIGQGSYTFPGGNSYRFQSPPSPDPGAYGQARVGSLKPGSYTDFYVAVDVVGWDDSIEQLGGVMARIDNAGPGTTTGYIFTHDRGNPPSATNGDMDIVRLDGEVATVLPNLTGSDSIHFDPTKQYRIVFMGSGENFTGQVYELPNLSEPVVNLTASDPTYTRGACGLLAANNAVSTGYDGPVDMTFDNFLMLQAEPRLSVATVGADVVVSWPTIPFTLQSTTSLNPPAWTPVTSGIVEAGGQFHYTNTPPLTAQYFRLAHP